MAHTGNAAEGVDFSGLILGFSSAALYYMGLATVEGKPAPSKNLPLARQNIDIIRAHEPIHVLILAGDHVHKMDHGRMLAHHA